jgi:uncharacterized protein (TIRG00374 family)
MSESHPVQPSSPPQVKDTIEDSTNISTMPVSLSRIIKSVLFFTVAGVLLYGIASLASGFNVTWQALTSFPVSSLALVLTLVIIGWLIRGWRFHYYMAKTGHHVPFGYSEAVFLASFSLTGTPGKMGEAAKGVLLKEDYGIPVTRTVGILVVERLVDLWAVLVLGSLSFLLFSHWRTPFILLGFIVVVGGTILCMERIYRPILKWLTKIPYLSWIAERVLGILLAGKELMTPRIFFIGLVSSIVAWGLEAICMYVILKGFDLHASLLEANFVYSFSTLLGALSMLPGGIGGTEVGMIGLLAFLGIKYENALPAVILIRLCTLWLAILVGAGFMLTMLARSGKRESVAEK